MGAGKYGPMKGMMFRRLSFDGPKMEAMNNMGPFKSFLTPDRRGSWRHRHLPCELTSQLHGVEEGLVPSLPLGDGPGERVVGLARSDTRGLPPEAGVEAGHYNPAIAVSHTTKAGAEAGHYNPAIAVNRATKAGVEAGHYVTGASSRPTG